MTFKIYTCLQNGTVDHTGSRCVPQLVTTQHDQADWVGAPRIENGVPECGGIYAGQQVDEWRVIASLDREPLAFATGNGGKRYPGTYLVWDHERASPVLGHPDDGVRAKMQREMLAAGDEVLPSVSAESIWSMTYNRWHTDLFRLWRKHRPGAAIGVYGYPEIGTVDHAAYGWIYRTIDFGCAVVHGDNDVLTDRNIREVELWEKRFRRNAPRPRNLMYIMPDLQDAKAFRRRWDRVVPLFESGRFQPVLWHGGAGTVEGRERLARFIKEEFPA